MQKRMISFKACFIPVSSVLTFVGVALNFSLDVLACPNPHTTPVNQPSMSSSAYLPPPATLKNSAWRLERWERQGTAIGLVPPEVSLRFNGDRLYGSSGCNRFSGTFALAKDRLSLGTLEATQRGCEPVVMDRETQFLAALQSANRIAANTSGQLIVFYTLGTEKGILHFAPQKN